jgi:hypothetical protein
MTAKLPRIVLAALGLSTAVVGATLAQQASDPRYPVTVRPAPENPGTLVPTVSSPYSIGQPAATTPSIGGPRGYGQPNTFFNHAWVDSSHGSGEEANLMRQAEQLARRLADAKSDSDRDKIKGDLRDMLEKQFELRQRRHEQEIEALEAQVKKLKDLVRRRSDNRREIVAKRLDQIVSDAEGLGW